MKSYTQKELADALRAVGITEGDIVFFSSRLYNVGRLEGVGSREEFCASIFDAFSEVIGDSGTIVVPTFTQQVGSHGVSYHHETTESRTGVFSEYVRKRSGSKRSFHPVFSLSACGPAADDICDSCSTSGFGFDSAMHRLHTVDAKAVCLGFDYYSGHIVSGMHVIESLYGVPYYYNKLITADVFKGGKQVDTVFVINVRYLDFAIQYDYRRFIDSMAEEGCVTDAEVGASRLYACSMRDMFDVGFRLLKKDVYSFLAKKPEWKEGSIPNEGPANPTPDADESVSWTGV